MTDTETKQKSPDAWQLYLHGREARWKNFVENWKIFRSNSLSTIGLVLIFLFGIMVFAHPILINTVWNPRIYDPYIGYDPDPLIHPSPPSRTHIFGTDGMGRDVFSQVLYGARMSFSVGIAAAITAVTLSTIFGGLAGFYGGAADLLLMGISDVFILMPVLIILFLIGVLVKLNWWTIAIIYGVLSGLGRQAIVIKSHTMSIKNKPFIDAARISGGGNFHVLTHHIVPNLLPVALVHAVITVVGAVLTESLLSFFSRTHDYMTWGSMIWLGQRTFRWFALSGQWNALIPPALAIMLFCSAFFMVGRALDDVINPRLRNR
jgi:peptide/nickel transport system permease protein